MDFRTRASYVAIAVGLVAITLLVRPLVRHVARLSGDITTTTRQLTAAPESVQDEAVQVRFRLRRQAVADMRADLLNVVTVEAQFHADSGYYTPYLPHPGYPIRWSPANAVGPIVLTSHGWLATITNRNVSIFCAVAVGPDRPLGDVPAGQPVCFGEHWPWGHVACSASGLVWDSSHSYCHRP